LFLEVAQPATEKARAAATARPIGRERLRSIAGFLAEAMAEGKREMGARPSPSAQGPARKERYLSSWPRIAPLGYSSLWTFT
jgi:hypothetical protein